MSASPTRKTLARCALALSLVLPGCAAGPQAQATLSAPTRPGDLARLSAAVAGHSGSPLQGPLEQVRFYLLAGGDRIGCGTWAAPDPSGNPGGRAPFYVRFGTDGVDRVHLDDLTGYGPARTGCSAAEARLTGSAG